MANGGDRRVRTRERESEGVERKNRGKSERVRGAAWRRPAFQGDEEAPGKQGGWWRGARARRARSPPSVEDEDDRGGGGLGRLLAGPAC